MEKTKNNNKICQCCGMPLDDEYFAHEHDGRVNEEYCKWCYHDGKFTYHNIDELIDVCVPHMLAQGFNEEQARSYLKEMLPHLNYWKNR